MATITVTSPTNTYDITIEAGILQTIAQDPEKWGVDGRVAIITNTTVAPLYGHQLAQALPDAFVIELPDGEKYKTLESVQQCYDEMLANGADRHTIVFALGGGVIGDMAGFVAATFMRGVRLVQCPTTLLSMVDSSVGGKVGVDLPQGKNLVGAFKQPHAVYIDPNVLQSLPVEQWRCGMGEVVKHGYISDPVLLDSQYHTPERAPELIQRAVQVKVDVVEEDPYEHGIRAFLNLGHTFAHAIELVSQFEWLHGEAVGFGLLCAVKLSHKLELCDESLVDDVENLVQSLEFPQQLGDLDPEQIYDAMLTDKKWKNGRSRFVLLEAPQKPTIVQDVSRDTVIEVLTELK